MPASSITPDATAATLIVGRASSDLRAFFTGEVRVQESYGAAPPPLDGIDQLVLADPTCSGHTAMNGLVYADRFGTAVWMHAALLPVLATAGIRPCLIGGMPLYGFPGLRIRTRNWPIEATSPLLAVLLLPALLPLLALLALRVWLTDGYPVVFAQRRIGRSGRPFTIYKFRTMQGSRTSQKITESGERLRRHGLDEVPQFFNLVRGAMALIGPRPLPVDEHPQGNGIGAWMATREQVMPGLTGLYQVCPRRRSLGLAEMCILDAYWMHNRSCRFNTWILLRTATAMFRGWGRK